MLLQCPICKHAEYVNDDKYLGGAACPRDPRHGQMNPVEEILIDHINIDLIDKFDIRSGNQWVFQMYKQFGFTSFDNILLMSQEDPNWLRKLRWTDECEDEFIQAVIEKNKSRVRSIGETKIRRDVAWLSLDVGPGIIQKEWKPSFKSPFARTG